MRACAGFGQRHRQRLGPVQHGRSHRAGDAQRAAHYPRTGILISNLDLQRLVIPLETAAGLVEIQVSLN